MTPISAKDKSPSRLRTNNSLSEKLTGNLKQYAAAAGAAGVGLMAISQSAEANVVYTATNITVSNQTTLDLNSDGVADFTFYIFPGSHSFNLAVKPAVAGNGIRPLPGSNFAAGVGFFGVPVGPGENFIVGSSFYGAGMANAGQYGSNSWFLGAWANAVNRYLGFKFLINGETHFGWARLNVPNFTKGGKVVITGYAYETVANRGLVEGHVSGPANAGSEAPAVDLPVPVNGHASLSALALGAPGLSIWRRENDSMQL